MELTKEEEREYTGGVKITLTTAAVISAVAAFILGLIDGLSNPKTCNR